MTVRRPLVLVDGQFRQLPAGDTLEAAQGFFRTVAIAATAAGQTMYPVPGGYTPGAIFVSLNGSALAPADFTAADGASVALESGAGIVVGSVLLVYVLSAFEVADALPLGGTAADSTRLGGQLPEYYLGGGSWGDITGALADQLDLKAALDAKLNGADADFTIIYPNGGTEASPANITTNTRYVEANPFPGHLVICKLEVKPSGYEWGGIPGQNFVVSFSTNTISGVGATAAQYGDNIIVQTGSSARAINPANIDASNPFGSASSFNWPLPCRVKVWKVKGAIV